MGFDTLINNSAAYEIDSLSEPSKIDFPYELISTDFLKFAKKDLQMGYEHCLITALGNIKKAIDCHLEMLLVSFGFSSEVKKRYKPSISAKIDILNDLGVIAPRILKKINDKRNLMEHEFIKPTKEDVEDALDIATLFIHYTEDLATTYIYEIECYRLKDPSQYDSEIVDYFTLQYDYKQGIFRNVAKEFDNEKNIKYNIHEEIDRKDSRYKKLLSLYIYLKRNQTFYGYSE